MWVSLNAKSSNRKTGPIPVSTTTDESCPKECPLKDTDCYARFNWTGQEWAKVTKRIIGDNWGAFCKRMRKFPGLTPFRHNQAGDLPPNKRGKIHKNKLRQLVAAVRHLRGWTYTHYDPTDPHNAGAIKEANDNGFTINLSADSLSQADEYVALGIAPVTVVLHKDAPHRGNKTPGGLPVVVCPAQTSDVNCKQCLLCEKSERKSIVGFLAHGTAKKRLSKRLAEQS